jgi:hypothetical protein
MISSVVVKKDTEYLNFIRIEINMNTGKMLYHIANYEFTGDLKEHAMEKHRIYLPCRITTDSEFETEPYVATIYIPEFWDNEAIENYTQALMDELYLFKHQLPGHKTLEQIESSFMLELLIL